MTNPFGPQGSNAAKIMPLSNTSLRYGDDQTWVRDCSANGADDGSVLDAGFFNNIIGNLTNLITSSGISNVTRGDLTLVLRAVEAIAREAVDPTVFAGAGVAARDGLLILALGSGTLPRLVVA